MNFVRFIIFPPYFLCSIEWLPHIMSFRFELLDGNSLEPRIYTADGNFLHIFTAFFWFELEKYLVQKAFILDYFIVDFFDFLIIWLIRIERSVWFEGFVGVKLVLALWRFVFIQVNENGLLYGYIFFENLFFRRMDLCFYLFHTFNFCFELFLGDLDLFLAWKVMLRELLLTYVHQFLLNNN